ncbi:MAG TPA: Flp pilus assembly protein CpaB [Candidatus Limnocylindria bacterium]|nr:Flp pilus assembly protein CpaB [Candidatus Limnocylindria bacterium]
MNEIRSWIFLALGLLLSGMTGLALYGVGVDASSRGQAAAAAESVEVLVTTADIPARTVLTGGNLTLMSYPRPLVPAGALGHTEEAVGQTTVAAIPKGAVVVREQLIAAGGNKGASISLEKGTVLVAFPTSDPLTLAGLVEAGDRVDVLVTIPGADGVKRTQTIVQNLVVVDVVRASAARTASLTFIVDPQVALVLKNLRDSQYTIDLSIRALKDTDSVKTTTVDADYVANRYGIRR